MDRTTIALSKRGRVKRRRIIIASLPTPYFALHQLIKNPSLAAYMYTFGNAGTGSTYRSNLEALEQWRIIPRMLRNATHRNLDVTTAALPATQQLEQSR